MHVSKVLPAWIILMFSAAKIVGTNAPISTAGSVVSSGTTATVPVTAINFSNIASCNLKLLYDPAIITVTGVTTGSLMGGNLTTDLSVSGIISLGWFTYPALTLPDNTVIFNIAVTKVTAGTSAITWSDNGYSCVWYDGNYIVLNDIPTSTYYIDGSVTFTGTLTADFTASNTTPPKNTTVQFTDLTTGGPTNWTWSFSRPSVTFVNGTSLHSQNPQVQFTESGTYSVTLEVSNTDYSDTAIKNDYIRAGIAGQWDGTVSSTWTTATNWDNWLVPGNSTDVVIPSSAPFWPIFTGNFVTGTNCKSVMMNGASTLVINGNFSINNGASLTIADNGILYVSGDWTNAGTFNAGTGTVEFTGNTQSTIISAGSPPVVNNFYHLTVAKTGSKLINPGFIVVNGNLKINP